jgi:hypothetical protein
MSQPFPGHPFSFLEMSLRQIFFIIKKLTADDRISLVLFSSDEKEVFPLTPCSESNKHHFMRLLSVITTNKSSWTSLGRGLSAALCVLKASQIRDGEMPPLSTVATADPRISPQHHRSKRVIFLSNFYFPSPALSSISTSSSSDMSRVSANEVQLVSLISSAVSGQVTSPQAVPSLQQSSLLKCTKVTMATVSTGTISTRSDKGSVGASPTAVTPSLPSTTPSISGSASSSQIPIYVSLVSMSMSGHDTLSLECQQKIAQIVGAKYYSFHTELFLEQLMSHDIVPVATHITLRIPTAVATMSSTSSGPVAPVTTHAPTVTTTQLSIQSVFGSSEFLSLNPLYGEDLQGMRTRGGSEGGSNELIISSAFPSPKPNVLIITLRMSQPHHHGNEGASRGSGMGVMGMRPKRRDEVVANEYPRKKLRFEDQLDSVDEAEREADDFIPSIASSVPVVADIAEESEAEAEELFIPLHVEWRDMNGQLHSRTLPLTFSSEHLRQTPRNHGSSFDHMSGDTSITTSPSSSSPEATNPQIAPRSSSPFSLPPQPSFSPSHSGTTPPVQPPLSSRSLFSISACSSFPSSATPPPPLPSEAYLLIEYVNGLQYYIQCISTDLMQKLLTNDFSEMESLIPDHVITNIRGLKRSGLLYTYPSLHVTGLMPSLHGLCLCDALLFSHIIIMKLMHCQQLLYELIHHHTTTTPSSHHLLSSTLVDYRSLSQTLSHILSLEKIEYEKSLTSLLTVNERKRFMKLCPRQYLCPISLVVMKHPVIASDGYSYEEEQILKWFREGNVTSPVTNQFLTSTALIGNKTLQDLIEDFLVRFQTAAVATTTTSTAAGSMNGTGQISVPQSVAISSASASSSLESTLTLPPAAVAASPL